MDETCSFCMIAQGTASSHSVFQDDLSLAFLDRRPLFPGHCLLIPKEHYPTLADLPVDLLSRLFLNAQLISRAVEAGLHAQGSFVAINNRVSQSVPHLHIHIVPRRKSDGLKGFFWPRKSYGGPEEIQKVQQTLRSAIAKLQAVPEP